MPRLKITHENGAVEEYDDVNVQLPDSFVTITDDSGTAIGIHERHVRRVELSGVTKRTDPPR